MGKDSYGYRNGPRTGHNRYQPSAPINRADPFSCTCHETEEYVTYSDPRLPLHMPDLNLNDEGYLKVQTATKMPFQIPTRHPVTFPFYPLRMPKLNLDDETYLQQIEAVTHDAQKSIAKQQKKYRQRHYHHAAQSPNVYGFPNIEKLEQAPPPETTAAAPVAIPNIELMMANLKKYEELYHSTELQRRYKAEAGVSQASLREDIRELVRNAEVVKKDNRILSVLSGVLSILQALLTTTAMLIYYLVWCYTQMMYFIMKSMNFFHNAEGSMKFAIALVLVTSILFVYSLIMKVQRFVIRW